MTTYPALEGMRLDRVSAYSDRISFLIPHHWVDLYEEDGNNYLYYREDHSEGWLRLTLMIVSDNDNISHEVLKDEMLSVAKINGQEYFEVDTNLVRRWREYSEREGVPIVLHYFVVARCVAPTQYYQAIFSYTVTSEQLKLTRIQQMIQMVGDLVCRSEFTYQVSSV